MKRFIIPIAICIACIMSSCVDDNYDLSNIDSDNVAIGGDDSEFLMPLLTIKLAASSIGQYTDLDAPSILDIQHRIDVWLPASLPEPKEYVDIDALNNDADYRYIILSNMFDEMLQDADKRKMVCDYIIDKYLDYLIDLLINSSNSALVVAGNQIPLLNPEERATILSGLFISYPDDVKPILREISKEDLVDTSLDDVYTTIPSLDISEDVEQMLSDNLDPASVENPINALYIFGEINNEFPCKFQIHPIIENTQIDLGNLDIDKTTVTIPETRIYREDLTTLFNGSQLIMPIKFVRYYPNIDLDEDSEISISISLRKTGGLKI